MMDGMGSMMGTIHDVSIDVERDCDPPPRTMRGLSAAVCAGTVGAKNRHDGD